MSSTTIYPARQIITQHPARPTATHVAVRDGRILGVGSLDELSGWGPHTLDRRFEHKVLMPGFVEGHTHLMAGSLWRLRYCGWFDATDPAGKTWTGLKSLKAVITALKATAADATGDAPVVGWGFDPIYYRGARCSRADLDRISKTRPVGVFHASGHILNVNTVVLERAGLLRQGVDHPGLPLGADGLPTGELKGPEAMGRGMPHVGLSRAFFTGDAESLRDFGRLAVRAGVTTATDLAATLTDPELKLVRKATGGARYPVRLVALLRFIGMTPEATVARAQALVGMSTDRLRLGAIKAVADGSIQGFSARLRWPGYFNRAPQGLWYTPPDALQRLYTLALGGGVQVHTHTNGDEATAMAIDAMEAALRAAPAQDHRFTLQHCQLADDAQFRRMAALDMGVNLFANHHFYWGDEHRTITVGPERAERMNACRSALDAGVPMAIHSDAPITPMAPLFTAWCAVNRITASGHVLGQAQRIRVDEALQAITIGAARTLKLDGEIGSIECGKQADFAVLEDDPLAVDPMALKDVKVWGTVQGGRVFKA